MDRQQILDLYDWAPGVCFRHPATGRQSTAHVRTLRTRGGAEDLRACRECVLRLEGEQERAAIAEGRDYKPGPTGDASSPSRENGGSRASQAGE